jgi:Spy/CpxP family protein refolding chaperone
MIVRQRIATWLRPGSKLVLAPALVAMGALAWAGGPRGGGDRMQARLQKMKEALSLTDDQASQVEAILREAASQAEADRAKAGGDRDALRSIARDRHRQVHEKIQALLTEEQRAKSAQLREDFRRNHRRGVRRRGPEEPAGPEAQTSPHPRDPI